MVALLSLPGAIISNRDKKFQSAFWKKLCEDLRINVLVSTTYSTILRRMASPPMRKRKPGKPAWCRRARSDDDDVSDPGGSDKDSN